MPQFSGKAGLLPGTTGRAPRISTCRGRIQAMMSGDGRGIKGHGNGIPDAAAPVCPAFGTVLLYVVRIRRAAARRRRQWPRECHIPRRRAAQADRFSGGGALGSLPARQMARGSRPAQIRHRAHPSDILRLNQAWTPSDWTTYFSAPARRAHNPVSAALPDLGALILSDPAALPGDLRRPRPAQPYDIAGLAKKRIG